MVIVLIGYMGSGKSTLGKVLSERINAEFLDLDNVIEEEVGLSIAKIFEEKGAIYFRKVESESLKHTITAKDNKVLALGGGTPCYSNNMQLIKKASGVVSFYLKLSISSLTKRLMVEKEHRPLIKSINDSELPEFIGKHLFERNPFYQEADYTIDCDNKTTIAIVAEIQEYLDKL